MANEEEVPGTGETPVPQARRSALQIRSFVPVLQLNDLFLDRFQLPGELVRRLEAIQLGGLILKVRDGGSDLHEVLGDFPAGIQDLF